MRFKNASTSDDQPAAQFGLEVDSPDRGGKLDAASSQEECLSIAPGETPDRFRGRHHRDAASPRLEYFHPNSGCDT